MFLRPERSVYSTAYRWTAAIPYSRLRSGVGVGSYPTTLAEESMDRRIVSSKSCVDWFNGASPSRAQ